MSEALQQGWPIATVCNAWTMPQERYNTTWIVDEQLGLVGTSMRKIRPVVMALIARLDEFRARVRQIENRAVHEVSTKLETLIDRSVWPCPPSHHTTPVSLLRED